MTRTGVLLAATIVVLMWALLSVRPAYPAEVASNEWRVASQEPQPSTSLPLATSHSPLATLIDPCPVLAVRIEGGHVQTLNCAVFLPAVEVRR